MKPIFVLLSACVLFLTPLRAQEVPTEHFIEVSGSAELEIEPNEIVLFVRLKEFEDNRQKVSLDKIDASFREALKAAGIDAKKLELAGGGAMLEKIGKRDSDSFREKSYQVQLSSASELEKLITKLESVQINQAYISRLDHTDKEKIKLDLKIKALQAAKTKAETLLKSIGSEIGKAIMVREIEYSRYDSPGVYMMNANVSRLAESNASDESATAFKKIKFREQVSTQFEIK